MNVDQIFERLYLEEGDILRFEMPDKKAFDSLRVQLLKRFAQMKAIGTESKSLCASYDRQSKVGSYWIGERRSNKGFFTIVPTEPANDNAKSCP